MLTFRITSFNPFKPRKNYVLHNCYLYYSFLLYLTNFFQTFHATHARDTIKETGHLFSKNLVPSWVNLIILKTSIQKYSEIQPKIGSCEKYTRSYQKLRNGHQNSFQIFFYISLILSFLLTKIA